MHNKFQKFLAVFTYFLSVTLNGSQKIGDAMMIMNDDDDGTFLFPNNKISVFLVHCNFSIDLFANKSFGQTFSLSFNNITVE